MLRYYTILVVNFLLFETCSGCGKASIFLSKYNNPGGKLADGSNCDPNSQCDHKFVVCVDRANGSLTDMGHCWQKYTTEAIHDKNQINFRLNTIQENPKEFNFNKWLGGLILKVQVWDSNQGKADGFVEFLSGYINIIAGRSKSESVRTFELKNRTQLTIEVAVYCVGDWFGPHCDCRPNARSGHHSCDSTTGDKICPRHRYGPNCDVNCWPVNGTLQGYDCGPDGSKICLENWFGPECSEFCQPSSNEHGHFECGPDGRKICHSGWKGVNCTVQDMVVDDLAGSTFVTQSEGYRGIINPYSTEAAVANTGFPPKFASIFVAVLVLIIVVGVSVTIWGRKRKQQLRQSEISQAQAYKVGLDAIEPYYITHSAQAQPMTDDNPYSDVDERTEAGRNTHCNVRQGAGNDTNTYINQREETENDTNIYINQCEATEAKASAYMYLNPHEDEQANTYLELLPN